MTEYTGINKKAAILQGIWFEGALFARILMQTIWITLWYQELMGKRVGWLLSGVTIFIALGVSTLLVRVFTLRAKWRTGLRPAIFATWMTLFLLASLKWLVWPNQDLGLFQTIPYFFSNLFVEKFDFGILWHTLLIPILIWQGVNLGKSRGSLSDTIQSFKFGILVMFVYGLLYMPAINVANSLPWLAYIFLGLLAMSVNRIADQMPLRGGRLPTSVGIWWAVIAVGALLLTVTSLLVGGVLPGIIRISVFIIIGVTLIPIALIVVVLLLLVPLIMRWLNPFFTISIDSTVNNLVNTISIVLQNDRLMKNWQKIGRHTIDEYILPGILVLVIAVIVLFIFIDLRSRRSWIRRVLPEENVSDILNRFRQGSRRGKDLQSQKKRWNANRILAAARIRQIYASLLNLAEKVGAPRHFALTPLEFLPTLDAAFTDHQTDTRLITEAYLKVRYGEYPETAEEVQGVERAWRTLRSLGRGLVLAKKREDRKKAKLKR